MHVARLVDALDRFARFLPPVIEGVPDDDLRWKPADGAWSILEVLCHLADEEVEDFRTRLALTLRDPAMDWPPINPEGVAVERRYNEQDARATLNRFVRERAASVRWLRGLDRPDWRAAHRHPRGFTVRAGDLLASWTAHDALHLRQIAKRLHQLAQRDAGEFITLYAGEWGP